jgi:hypothetical protein
VAIVLEIARIGSTMPEGRKGSLESADDEYTSTYCSTRILKTIVDQLRDEHPVSHNASIQLRFCSGIRTMEINILFVLCCIEQTVVSVALILCFRKKKSV